MNTTTNNSVAGLYVDQRGTSVLEFVLLLPSIVLVIVIMISLGQTVILRQHALVAARYSAFYERVTGNALPGHVVSDEVSGNDETWTVSDEGAGTSSDLFSAIETGSGPAEGLFSTLVSEFDQGLSIHTTVGHVPQRNVVVEIFHVSKVSAEYSLPRGDWTSDNCGSYLPLLLDRFKIAGVGVHI